MKKKTRGTWKTRATWNKRKKNLEIKTRLKTKDAVGINELFIVKQDKPLTSSRWSLFSFMVDKIPDTTHERYLTQFWQEMA